MRQSLVVLLAVVAAACVATALAPAAGEAKSSKRDKGSHKGTGKAERSRESACPLPSATPRRSRSKGRASSEAATGAGKKGKKGKKRKKPVSRYCSSGGQARGDFNGDGVGDLAVGVPGEDRLPGEPVGKVDSGAVNVIYGGRSVHHGGLLPNGNRMLPGLISDERFGSALAAGDFNGDGFSDLAVGSPGFTPLFQTGLSGVGLVRVFHGSPSGFSSVGTFHQQRPGPDGNLIGESASGDRFGSSLVWGHFNGDAYADLAIGVPFDDVADSAGNLRADAGAVNVVYGSAGGLSTTNNQLWSQESPGVPEQPEGSDRFGAPLAGGDFDADGFGDLAVGVPLEAVGTPQIGTVGGLNVIYGSQVGLSTVPQTATAGCTSSSECRHTEAQFHFQGQNAVNHDPAESGDQFASALAAGDFNGDGSADLAAGVPFENVGTIADAGAVDVLLGSLGGLMPPSQTMVQRNVVGANESPQAGDHFGSAVATGKFGELLGGDDGFADLAVGVPDEDIRVNAGEGLGRVDAGAVNVFTGKSGAVGLSDPALGEPGYQLWHQSSPEIVGSAEPGDRFGAALTAWNFGLAPASDLAVGVPGEDLAATSHNPNPGNEGAVSVLYSRGGALDKFQNEFWSQDRPGVAGDSKNGDAFGAAVY